MLIDLAKLLKYRTERLMTIKLHSNVVHFEKLKKKNKENKIDYIFDVWHCFGCNVRTLGQNSK